LDSARSDNADGSDERAELGVGQRGRSRRNPAIGGVSALRLAPGVRDPRPGKGGDRRPHRPLPRPAPPAFRLPYAELGPSDLGRCPGPQQEPAALAVNGGGGQAGGDHLRWLSPGRLPGPQSDCTLGGASNWSGRVYVLNVNELRAFLAVLCGEVGLRTAGLAPAVQAGARRAGQGLVSPPFERTRRDRTDQWVRGFQRKSGSSLAGAAGRSRGAVLPILAVGANARRMVSEHLAGRWRPDV
jgi:hypothetical protein